MPIARYSFIQLSELEQCRIKKLAQGFNTAAQDSNPGSLSRESKALPQSHCALQHVEIKRLFAPLPGYCYHIRAIIFITVGLCVPAQAGSSVSLEQFSTDMVHCVVFT